MIDYHPYIVTNLSGDIVLQAAGSCRYPRLVELALPEAGYTLRLNGQLLTRADIRKRGNK